MTEVDAESRFHAVDTDRPRLHIHPDHGWLNDPNGLCRIDGIYHVFFQHNPAGPYHDDIHWGHVSSPDLLHWSATSVALAPTPDGPDRGGCWSGCIVDDEGVPTAVYTGVRADARDAGVTLSRSDRSLCEWVADDDWRIGTPDDPAITDVRDPFVFVHAGRRYAVQGAGRRGGSPQLLLYGCDDLTDWTYLGALLTTDDPIAATVGSASIWECPSLFRLGENWVLLLSLWRDDVLSGVRYLVGDLVAEGVGLRFVADSGGTLDTGPTFYAPQALVETDRVLLWGWAWEGTERTAAEIDAAGWCGTLTSPREVVLRGGDVRLEPAAELVGLRRERLDHPPGAALETESFEANAPNGLRLLLVDPTTGLRTSVAESEGASRLLVDGSLVELFGLGPSYTTRAYPGAERHWVIESAGPVEVWRLGLPVS
jgi:beta-fructofuranosidase